MNSVGSSPFVNSVLFGHSKKDVDADYIEKLKPFMHRCEVVSIPQEEETPIHFEVPAPIEEVPLPVSANITPTQKNTLFWSIFLAVHEYP